MSFEGQRRSPQTENPILPRVPQEMQKHIQVTGEKLKLKQVVPLTPDVWKSDEGINKFITELTAAVMIFYARANEVLEQEIPGMNDHSLKHIRGVMQISENLVAASQESGVSVQQLSDLLTLYATVVLHDVAQGIWGRIDHARLGAMVAQAIITNPSGRTDVANIISKVALYVRQHVTREYDFSLAKVTNDFPYAVAVLADECHIKSDRVTEEGRVHFAEHGAHDEWYLLNRMVKDTSWSWDSKERCPRWTLEMEDIKGIGTEIKANRDSGGSVGLDLDGQAVSPEVLCYALISELVLVPKINLFRSACRAIFNTPDFIVSIQGQDTVQTYHCMKNPSKKRN